MTAWMNHPILPDNQLIEVPESAVQGHRQMGWKVTDPPPDAEVSVAPEGGPVVEHATDEPGKE